jgi:hypothetical protein
MTGRSVPAARFRVSKSGPNCGRGETRKMSRTRWRRLVRSCDRACRLFKGVTGGQRAILNSTSCGTRRGRWTIPARPSNHGHFDTSISSGGSGHRWRSGLAAFQRDLAKDLRSAVINRVTETGLPSVGHGAPFMRTRNWRCVKGAQNSRILRCLFRRKSLTEIRKSAFIGSC